MLGLFGRFFLLRFLPRRLVPLLTLYEVYRLVRGVRAGRPSGAQPKTPIASGRAADLGPQAGQGVRARVGR